MKERMPEEIIQKEVSARPEKEIELDLARSVSNLNDLVHTVDGKTRDYFRGLEENFRGALGWLEAQKGKAARIVIAGSLVGQLATACSPRTVSAGDIISSTPAITQEYIPEPAETEILPTITAEPSPTATLKPTEAPTPVRPGSGGAYPEEVWEAIESGEFEVQEKGWITMLDYYGNAKESERPLFAQEPGSEKSTLMFKYLLDTNNPDNTESVIVALESSDYPNTAILPPIDFEKSDGLSVYFLESLPFEKDEHGVPSYLMPTFLTIDAGEESVKSGKMQERFLNTTLTNKGGELVRIDSEGKVIAKIGVKQETQEARWVRPLQKDYSDPKNYTPITIAEIQNGQIFFDEEIQAEPFPEDVEFPSRFELNVNEISGSVRGYYANGEPTTKFYRNAFFYMLDEKQDGWILNAIISQQYLNKDGSWSFVKRTRSWNGENPEKWVEKLAPDMAMLPTFFLPAEALTQSGWEYYRKINNDDTIFSLDGNLQKLYEEYTITGFIPNELTRYIISGRSYVKVK